MQWLAEGFRDSGAWKAVTLLLLEFIRGAHGISEGHD